MVIYRTLIVLTLTFGLAACGGVIARSYGINFVDDPADAAEVRERTEMETDVHQARVKFKGPIVYARDNILKDHYFLRAWLSTEVPGTYSVLQIYVVTVSDDWLFLDTARSYGKSYRVSQIDREVSDCDSYGKCTFTEQIGVNLTPQDVTRFGETGFDFQVSGRGGSREFSIPAGYFKGFAAAVGTHVASTAPVN